MSYLKHKPGSIEEVAANMSKYAAESEYQDMFKKELEKAGKGIGAMTPKEKKAFFNKIDSKYTAKDEETKINEISDKDKRDNLQKLKTINDMVADIPGVNNNEYKRLVDLGKPLNYYENPRGATDAQKKYYTDFAKKFSNKMSFSDKREYEGYIKAVTEAVDNPYAVGMAQAMKAKDDQPPLKKSTITKAHDIAKSIMKKEGVELNEDKYTDTLIKNFHGAYTRNVRRPKAYSQSLGLILDKIKKMVKPGSNQYKKAIETLKSIKGFDKITDYQSQILKDFKPIRQKAINIMMNIKKELSDLSKVDYNNQQNVNKHIDTLINLNKKLEPEVKEDYTKKEMKEARWEIEGRVSYKGVGPEDGFHMIIDAPSESAAEDKAYDELEKARKQRKIGPGGGGSIDDMEIEYIEKTNDRLKPVSQVTLGNSYDPTQKEEVHPHVKKMVKDGESDEKIKKMHPELKDDELEKLKETHSFVTNKQNEKQKEVGGEKEPIKTSKNEWKTFAMMAAELREKKEEKKEQEAGEDTRDPKDKTMTGKVATSPEMNPRVDYKY